MAICDIDDDTLEKADKQRFNGAAKFNDFRKMLDEMGNKIDAVTVSTPDHNHAAAALLAMRAGKHCFCQKPLTHTIYEADCVGPRCRREEGRHADGQPGHGRQQPPQVAAMVRGGAVGDVKEVHVWTNRPIWPQGGSRPTPKASAGGTCTGTCGSAPPNHGRTATAITRSHGAASGISAPVRSATWPATRSTCRSWRSICAIRSPSKPKSSGHNSERYPKWSIIKFEFPENDTRPALTMTWYDGGKKPDEKLFEGKSIDDSGVLVVGSEGKLYAPGDYCEKGYTLLGSAHEPKVEFEKSPGHFAEWVRAIKTNNEKPARSNFPTYASRLTKTILLGNLAVWAGVKVEWDANSMRATSGIPELDNELQGIVKPTYRQGYTLEDSSVAAR